MKRKQLHQSRHPFNPQPFEAFWSGSWQPVEELSINEGSFLTHIVDDGEIVEDNIPLQNLRLRSREATLSDCMSFLRPGIDVCVLSDSHISDEDDQRNGNPKLAWLDARIRSIERKTHSNVCSCKFYVSFYLTQGPELFSEDKMLSKKTSMMSIYQISIIQNLEQKPTETMYYRWSSTEDCFSVNQARCLPWKFCSDISWLLVASVMKKTGFYVRSIQNRIVYEIMEGNPSHRSCYAVSFKLLDSMAQEPVIVKFVPDDLPEGSDREEYGSFPSYDFTELRRSKRRHVQPERFLACDNLPDYEVEVTRLGGNKIYKADEDIKVEYNSEEVSEEEEGEMTSSEEEVSEDEQDELFVPVDDDENEMNGDVEDFTSFRNRKTCKKPQQKSRVEGQTGSHDRNTCKKLQQKSQVEDQTSSHERKTCKKPQQQKSQVVCNFKTPKEEPEEDIGEMISEYMQSGTLSLKKDKQFNFIDMEVGSGSVRKGPSKKYAKKSGFSSRSGSFYVGKSVYDYKSLRGRSTNGRACRELIRRCMINIDDTLRNKPNQLTVVEQWKEFQEASKKEEGDNEEENLTEKNPTEENLTEENQAEEKEEELSEVDMMWREMGVALAEWYLSENEEHNQPEATYQDSRQAMCKHDYILNDQIGIVCRFCGFVETHIKDYLPPFASTPHRSSKRERTTAEASERKTDKHSDIVQYTIPTPSNTLSNDVEKAANAWALIPELGNKLRYHQRKAFEFLWRNIAGSMKPSRMEKKKKKRGGCVISHTPGAGKTLLIIAFLVSYLKLFPGSRPLILAPKTALYTWYKELIKWKISVPVYRIHGVRTYNGEVLQKVAPGLPKDRNVLHVLDSLEKMQNWLSHPSILLMGYPSFLTLTREDSTYPHRKYMAQLLNHCPGILILDEGHNPRSTNSRLRKGLMKVDTRLRILLSGTLFQNNFGEYFNTLCLARPSFVNEVLKELDPKYEKRSKEWEWQSQQSSQPSQHTLENRGRKFLIDKVSKKIDSKVAEERDQALMTLKKLTGKFIDVYEGGDSDNLPGLQCYTLMMKLTSLQQEVVSKLQFQRAVNRGFPLELELLNSLAAIHPWLIKSTACSSWYLKSNELEDLERSKFDAKAGSKVRFVMSLVPRCVLRNEKVLIFCHNISPINLFVQMFERFYGWRKGREVLVLQGDMELFERGTAIDKFEEVGGESKVMLASITACAEGISLTAASRVILIDSEWNPSRSKQAIARAFRPGQNRVVYVYQLLAAGTMEEEKHGRTTWKEWVSDMIFSEERVEEADSRWEAPRIEDELLREMVEEDRAVMFHQIIKNDKASKDGMESGMLEE